VEVFDGNDAFAVYEASARAAERARMGEGPSVLEGLTYRIDPHRPVIDKHLLYRPAGEIADWRSRDPLPRMRHELARRNWISPGTHEALVDKFAAQIAAAWQRTRQAPPPSQAMLEERMADL
jgi:pyruvate dehydrogenase E1 component alpha subunit